jgi:hypothetical protein
LFCVTLEMQYAMSAFQTPAAAGVWYPRAREIIIESQHSLVDTRELGWGSEDFSNWG